MASSYALPLNSTSETHHAHSRANFLSDRPPSWISQVNSASSVKKAPAPTANGAPNHYNTEHNGHLHNLEIPSHIANHNHTHSHSTPVESSFDSRSSAMGRRRGESDLGRPPTRKSNAGGKSGFSPIEETPAPVLPLAPLLALPEVLTAILIPLPFIFASMAHPIVTTIPHRFHSGIADSTDNGSEIVLHSSSILHACALSSATLILVGIISQFSSPDQTLDRRKPLGKSRQAVSALLSVDSLVHIGSRIASVLLPFYAATQLGGMRVAIVLLTAVAAGFGSLDHRPVKHSLLDTWKKTLRTRKFTGAILLLGIICDFLNSSANYSALLFGHLALTISVMVIPPPLPTTGMPLMTTGLKDGVSNGSWNPQMPSRLSLPKPISPLNSSAQGILVTLAAGALLATLTIIASLFSVGSLSFSAQVLFFSLLSVASATALIFFSLPSSLRTPKKYGLALGSALIGAFGLFGASSIWKLYIPAMCALSFAAVTFDTPSTSTHQHSHSHSHDHGHKHSHSHKHDHHLHGNHSRLSEFLIKKCTPGSIAHSILLEKDSRRIAYFGVLNLSFMLVQFFYGFVSGSLGLLTDSIHMLFDCAGLAVGLAAAVMSKWHPNMRFPYGYGKIDTLSGFANGIFLMLVSVEIVFDAFERLWEGHELHRLNELLVVSVLGFLVNIVGLTAFGHAHHGHGHDHGHDHGEHSHDGHSHGHSHSHDNENMQGIFLHILADALGSVAVIISTLLTKYYGWSGWDPIASCIIAVLIFFSALPLVKSSAMRLLLSLPADLEYGTRNTLQELSSLRGVVGYTVPRFWLEDAGAAHAEVHAHEKHDEHSHSHSHGGDCHNHHSHDHGHDHSHDDSHSHSHQHTHDHAQDHSPALSHHDHAALSPQSPHGAPPGQQKVLGVIHIIAARNADLEDVRERTEQFLKGRNMFVVVHVEREGEGRCWCGGGVKGG